METERIAGLTAEIKGQLWLMEKVSSRLIRHAYGTEIELSQLQANLSSAQQLYSLIQQDIDIFLAKLTATSI